MKKILSLLFLLFLSSCNPPFDYIDSDDFGYPKLTISSLGSNVFSNSPTGLPQCSYWTNSNMSLNGDRLFIMVKGDVTQSYWSPWLQNKYGQPCGFSCVNSSDPGCGLSYNYDTSDGSTATTNVGYVNNATSSITTASNNSSSASPSNTTIASNLLAAFNYIATNKTTNIANGYYGRAIPTATSQNIAPITTTPLPPPSTLTKTTPNNGTYTTTSVTTFTATATIQYIVTSSITYTVNFDDMYSDISNAATEIATMITNSNNAIFANAHSSSSGTNNSYVFIPSYTTTNSLLGNAIDAFNTSTGAYYDINTCPDYAYDTSGTQVGCKVYNSQVMYDPGKLCYLSKGDGLYGLVVPPNQNIDGNTNIACDNLPVNTDTGAGTDGYYGFHLGGNPIFYDTTNTNCLDASALTNNLYCTTSAPTTPNPLPCTIETGKNSCTIQDEGSTTTCTKNGSTTSCTTTTCTNSCLTSGYNNNLPDSNLINTNQGDLYFKIVDNYYPDNIGSYTIMLKSGVGYQNSGPIATFVSTTMSFFNNISKCIYQGLIPQIAAPVNAMLILYVIFSGITLMFGISKMNNKQLMLHLFKVGFVVQLTTSSTSWDFFNGYFLDLFTNGVDDICCLIATGGSCTDGSTNLNFFDNLIADFFSYETQMKIWSLVINDIGFGLVEAILIEIGLLFFLIMIGYAAIFYVIGFLAITLLISLFPIFLPFILFSMTKDIFNNWLKMIVSNSMEPIIVIAFLALSAQTITNQFHILLGFPIKYETIPGIPSEITNLIDIKTWIAQKPPKFNTETDGTGYANMLIPENIVDVHGNPIKDSNGNLCIPYACSCYRIPTLPYLQPSQKVLSKIGKSGTPCDDLGYDNQPLIDQIMNTGKYTNQKDSFSFLILTGVLMIFIKSVPSIARSLVKGTAQTNFDLSNAPSSMASGLKSMTAGLGGLANRVLYNRSATYRTANEALRDFQDSFHKRREQLQDGIGGRLDYTKKLALGDASTEEYKAAPGHVASDAMKVYGAGKYAAEGLKKGFKSTAKAAKNAYNSLTYENIKNAPYNTGKYFANSTIKTAQYGLDSVSQGAQWTANRPHAIGGYLGKKATATTEFFSNLKRDGLNFDFSTPNTSTKGTSILARSGQLYRAGNNLYQNRNEYKTAAYEYSKDGISTTGKAAYNILGEIKPSKIASDAKWLATNPEGALNKISGLSTNEFIQSRFIHDPENDKPIIHHMVARADQVINKTLDFVNFVNRKGGSDVRHDHVDLYGNFEKIAGKDIGATLDSALNVYHVYKDHALHQATGGLLGSDMNKPADARYSDRSRLESASANLSHALGADEDERKKWEEYLKAKGQDLIFEKPFSSTAKKIYTLAIGDGKKATQIQNELEHHLSSQSTAEFNKDVILNNLRALKNPTRNVNLTLSNGNTISLRADQLTLIMTKTGSAKNLEDNLLKAVADGNATSTLSKEAEERLGGDVTNLNHNISYITSSTDIDNLKTSVDEIYKLKPNQKVQLQTANGKLALTAKDLNDVLSKTENKNTLSEQDIDNLLGDISNKVESYQTKESIKKIATLTEQLSENARKEFNGEGVTADEKLMPYEVSSHLKRAALLAVLFPPLAIPSAALAVGNTVRNIRNMYGKLNDKRLKTQINDELINLQKIEDSKAEIMQEVKEKRKEAVFETKIIGMKKTAKSMYEGYSQEAKESAEKSSKAREDKEEERAKDLMKKENDLRDKALEDAKKSSEARSRKENSISNKNLTADRAAAARAKSKEASKKTPNTDDKDSS